jgi:ABC-type nitrate/sulfonate/bicarbonate transport system substrate-binding protein
MARALFASIFWIVLLLPAGPGAAQEQHLVAYGGFAGFQAPVWAAKDLGLFDKYGLGADVVMIPGSTRGIQALVGNSVHFAQVDAVTTLNAIYQGADLVMIAGSLNTFPFSFVAQKEIRRPQDLVGKRIGIVAFGGANDLAVTLALREWNVPRQSVTIVQSGGAATRLAALVAGALDATVLAYPELGEAIRLGMNVLAHMNEMKTAAFPMNVIVVRRPFHEKNREAVKRFQQAYAEATYTFKTNKEKALAVLSKRLQQKNPKALEETYQYFAASFAFPTRVSHEGLRNTLEMIAQRHPAAKDAPLQRFLEERTLDELEKEGFFKRLSGVR